ncbi:c-type cytochrome [Roseovarius sp.]|uniref:c-type cytochrome n=1 Tax=Roseovarius sp. TaxID=1486281 RepID=UPI0025F320E2|nr:c-type cytochrome [Roseovarius sp.]
MPRLKIIAGAALSAILATATGGLAQDVIGKDEFQQRCAACHGMDGRGDGVVAGLFATPPKNLTGLSKANAGVFPRERVYNSITGTHKIAGHGSSKMPLWGRYFTDEVRRKGLADPTPMQKAESDIVRGRILSLVYYIESIQAE